ncbi:MAG: transketolase [Erysipelotrichales bacterium]|nr:transketolase [Erysipelotrichales bacterium]
MDNNQQLAINTIRILGVDAVNKAKSGHPGMVLGSAPTMFTLYSNFINANPKKTSWINRDRFVLASGHASMLLYATLHLCKYNVSIDDIKNFRQLDSKTPGHPEYGHTDGVDATSGPLGQGIAHAVGMAMAEKFLSSKYNKENFPIFDHYTYALCGDGDLFEGVTQEAISLAGHLKLNKLILIYDCNSVTLDGNLDMAFSEDVKKRFESCEWNVLVVDDANNIDVTNKMIKKAKKSLKPTLIITKSIIGYLSKNENTCKVHGSPLGEEDAALIKEKISWKYDNFEVPQEVYDVYENTFIKRGKKNYNKWNRMYKNYKNIYPELAKDLENNLSNSFSNIEYPSFPLNYKEATRNTSNKIINVIAKNISNLVGGAADVAKSVNTNIIDGGEFSYLNYSGRNINFGIREFAMSCAQTGMLLHGGLRTFVGSFLVFSDYFKASIRTTSLMKLPAIYVLTHDSIAVGEDGPTHQPIEQLSSLRLIPNVNVLRPANANETSLAWKFAIESKKSPTCLILSRQDLVVDCEIPNYSEFLKGAYVASKECNKAIFTIISSGSEVNLAINAQKELLKDGIDIRVVSMPSWNLFNDLSSKEQFKILKNDRENIIAVEMAASSILYKYAKYVYDINAFGKSGKASDVIANYKFSTEDIVNYIKSLI